ncbi:Mitogen-activated protein kinase kinase kinase NPK1 [Camellia lanceoleosa]|uniref:Mitogen-activated protein kinase kinase kinase NPK1 n=1 Tax=Camellia lanceoleosa TaxID=1840588 RepID=A0ACC0I1B8_9ERIC|nr:Mitogen-activated protein kinase kinase kinase NPK1 [Camellia lanceoleosa]
MSMIVSDDEDDLVIGASAKFDSALLSDDFNKSFNSMSEPANIWNVGCTVIEMAIGKPLWSQQYQEGVSRNLSYVTCFSYAWTHAVIRTTYTQLKDVHNSVRCSNIYPEKFIGSVPHWRSGNCEDDKCQIDDVDDPVIGASTKFDSALLSDDFNKIDDVDDLVIGVLAKFDSALLYDDFNKVATLFYIGTTKSQPPIPEHLSAEAIDILLNCNYDDDMCQIDDEDDLLIGTSTKFDSALHYDHFNKVVALFHIGTTKSHPPIPEHLSAEAIEFFVKMSDDEDDLVIGALAKFDFAVLSDDFNKIDDEDDLVIGALAKFDSALHSDDFHKVAALFHIGTTKSHPPIPEHLSAEAIDFLLNCLQKEPNLRPTASNLLHIGDEDDLVIGASAKFDSALHFDDFNKSFNPMSEPADIWSVRCTVIEMATGKPPWSQQYQEVVALFHIRTTKSHPHISAEAIDFLLKCLQKEPNLRLAPLDLLQHPFVAWEYLESYPVLRAFVVVSIIA